MRKMHGNLFLFLCALFLSWPKGAVARLTEQERVVLWHKNGHTWPPTWQEESHNIKKVLEDREANIMQMKGGNERWENWLQFTQNRMVPRFTEIGFEVVSVPEDVFKPLRDKVKHGVQHFDDLRYEGKVDVIYNPPHKAPKFVNIGTTARETLAALQPMHEAWAGGIKLKPSSAYGVRLYQNGSTLVMHYDRIETHVISSIVHIAHEYDNDDEPWDIQIEDHNGRLHSVSLSPGQMLFYESAKCLHGRMTKLKGKYYGSIFLHYSPEDKELWPYTKDEVIARVPPHWKDGLGAAEDGERWAGACITVDDRITEWAPNRTTAGGHQTPLETVFPADTVFVPPLAQRRRTTVGASVAEL